MHNGSTSIVVAMSTFRIRKSRVIAAFFILLRKMKTEEHNVPVLLIQSLA